MINAVHTACKNCVFAIYNKQTQSGCELNYIDDFKKNNEEIIEVYDNDLEFFVINNKKCLGYRELSWFKGLGLEDATMAKKKDYFLTNNHINYLLVIDLKDMDSSLEALSKSILRCSYKPQKVILVRYTKDIEKFAFDVLDKFLRDTNLSSTPWRIQTMENNESKFEDILHTIISLNKKNRFIAYVRYKENENYYLKEILLKANNIVYEQMKKFDIISDLEKRCVLFSAPSYRFGMLVLKKDIFQDNGHYTYI